jgi:hypothetical protein
VSRQQVRVHEDAKALRRTHGRRPVRQMQSTASPTALPRPRRQGPGPGTADTARRSHPWGSGEGTRSSSRASSCACWGAGAGHRQLPRCRRHSQAET